MCLSLKGSIVALIKATVNNTEFVHENKLETHHNLFSMLSKICLTTFHGFNKYLCRLHWTCPLPRNVNNLQIHNNKDLVILRFWRF